MKKLLIAIICLSLTSCATITTGTSQSVTIDTGDVKGAVCTLTNDKGKWHLPSTPSSVTVQRAYGDLSVVCTKGNKAGSISVKSNVKGMAAGNILFGGIVGAAVDSGSGAGFDYPAHIYVPIK